MSSQKYQLAFLLLTTSLLFSQSKAGFVICKKNIVEIRNELGVGRLLEFHPYSNKDNLGIKYMEFNATPYQIRFYDEVPGLTTWNCILRQGIFLRYSYDVQMYKAGPRLIPRCGQLRIWSARLDGIYFARHAKDPLVKVLDWNS